MRICMDMNGSWCVLVKFMSPSLKQDLCTDSFGLEARKTNSGVLNDESFGSITESGIDHKLVKSEDIMKMI